MKDKGSKKTVSLRQKIGGFFKRGKPARTLPIGPGNDGLARNVLSQSKKNDGPKDGCLDDARKLRHELEVHQIELELQNEELRTAKGEAELSAQKYAVLFDIAPSGYFTCGENGTILELNLSGAQLLGQERNSLVNCNLGQFVSTGDKSVFNDFLALISKTGSKQSCEVKLNGKGKDIAYIYLEGIISEDPAIHHLTAIDITKRRQAEEALRETEEKYRMLLDESSDPIFSIYPDGQYIYVNNAFANGVGRQREDIIGNKIGDIFPHEEAEKRLSAARWVFENGGIKVIQVRVQLPEGDRHYITTIKPIFNKLGEVDTVICISKDITERKLAEEKLELLNQQLKELNASKDKFFSIIAHDLKSPFNAIIGFSNLMTGQVHNKNYDAVEEYAAIIKNASFRAMSLLMNLLEWANSQTGRMGYNPEYIELMETIEEVIELSKDFASQKSIAILKDLPESLIAFVDKDMISAILRNLISNAIKFSFPGGQLTISSETTKDEIKVAVSDNGVGLKKEAICKLWRIDESYSTIGTNNEKGTGLGLLLCKEFIDKHGGKIGVESEPGIGSRFYFTLPK